MGQYVAKRVLLMVPVLLGISILTFVFMRILPGDVLDVMYAGSPLSVQDIAKIRHQLGMDKPMPVQYWDWISGLARLDAANRSGPAGPSSRKLPTGSRSRSSSRFSPSWSR